MKKKISSALLMLSLACAGAKAQSIIHVQDKLKIVVPSIIVLGNVQDGGSPHIGCTKNCCKDLFEHPDPARMVSSLGVIDPENKLNWLLDATPNLPFQLKALKKASGFTSKEVPDGIFITHAHIGHYAGLMYLGREALNAKQVPVYAMPKMKSFLENNGPWSQLVSLANISIRPLENEKTNVLSSNIKITPFKVPHRDEFSETVGYLIAGPHKKALFIPDIDKWSKWNKNIVDEIKKADYAFIDATFYDAAEMNNRPIAEIPHPLVVESMELFKNLSPQDKDKIYFIHLNHTNPLLNTESGQTKTVLKNGFHIARYNDIFEL
ncbi:pyrroloquinoline quinone biosynthesis protein B [Pedobacter cryoconitis]|uniref:Pyrroloquinoline quinone biosynthesis protein B n=1 Tax=Pedobacter cryoconitis TaxID=188932 RepID=A0A7W8ZHU0_9SPHI|nr:MBL fold metallo-hydrolase [Pedobacter cryoconitis]MBB5634247.1 pyrroloquinoline quinone biosynthesis protein B [Pedobacter cryoconitis]